MDKLQLRAARAMLGLSLHELSRKVDISHEAISKIESGQSKSPRAKTVEVLMEFFNSHDIEFTEQSGVRIRTKKVIEISGKDCYLKMLEDVYHSLDPGGELLIANADDKKSPYSVNNQYRRIRSKGIRMRQLIEEGNKYIMGPLDEYRYLKSKHFHNSVIVCFGTKIGSVLDKERKVLIVDDDGMASSFRSMFESIWEQCPKPEETIANEMF